MPEGSGKALITYKIHLIRTGKTSDSPMKPYVGQTDVPLCDAGRAELETLRDSSRYPRVEMVYTSPLSRCRETAEILYPDLYTVTVDGFADMNLGAFEGRTLDELKDDGDFARWLENSVENAPPGGEDPTAFTRRIILALQGIFRNMMDERMTSVAVITHGGVIMTLLAAIGLPKHPMHEWITDNGCGYTLLMTPQMWMRDRAVEIYARIPEAATDEDEDWETYGDFHDD
jgi:alpha-ribazole phosphatase